MSREALNSLHSWKHNFSSHSAWKIMGIRVVFEAVTTSCPLGIYIWDPTNWGPLIPWKSQISAGLVSFLCLYREWSTRIRPNWGGSWKKQAVFSNMEVRLRMLSGQRAIKWSDWGLERSVILIKIRGVEKWGRYFTMGNGQKMVSRPLNYNQFFGKLVKTG